MHHGLGHACRQLAQYPEALEHLTKAPHIHRRFDWREGEAITLGNLGMVHAEQGRLTLAVDHHLRARALHRETGARASEAIALNNLGEAYRALGDTDAALRHHHASWDMSHGSGFRQSEGEAAIGLAATHLHEGQVAEALDRVHDAVTAARSAGSSRWKGARSPCSVRLIVHVARHKRPDRTGGRPWTSSRGSTRPRPTSCART
ncbi:tetratricopeptide repeat protein [Streptomyces violascens]